MDYLGGGAEEAGVDLGDVKGYSSIGKDACGDEVGGAKVAERGGQEIGEQGINNLSTEEEETLTETERKKKKKKEASDKGKEREKPEDADAEGSMPVDGDVDMGS